MRIEMESGTYEVSIGRDWDELAIWSDSEDAMSRLLSDLGMKDGSSVRVTIPKPGFSLLVERKDFESWAVLQVSSVDYNHQQWMDRKDAGL